MVEHPAYSAWCGHEQGYAIRTSLSPYISLLMPLAVDHPHGGGRGKSKGNRNPTSPWGRTPVCCLHNFARVLAIANPFSSPKVVSKRAEQATSTSGWLFPEYATTESAEIRRASRLRYRREGCILLYTHMYNQDLLCLDVDLCIKSCTIQQSSKTQ